MFCCFGKICRCHKAIETAIINFVRHSSYKDYIGKVILCAHVFAMLWILSKVVSVKCEVEEEAPVQKEFKPRRSARIRKAAEKKQ